MAENPVLITNTTDTNRLLANKPLLTSEALGWQGLVMEYRYSPDASGIPEIYTPWHFISFICEAPKTPTVVRSSGGKRWQDQARIGEPVIVPASVGYGVEWDTGATYLNLIIEPTDFATAINLDQDASRLELVPQFSLVDPLLFQLSLGLKQLLNKNTGGDRLYAETLIHTLMVHLHQHYVTKKIIPKVYENGLASAKLRLILDYIESHLETDLGLKELAKLLQLSPHYFASLFKQSMGITPHQYVIQQRVERAKMLLAKRHLSIAAVAYQVGFSSQAHLNRHFKKWVGLSPGAFRRAS